MAREQEGGWMNQGGPERARTCSRVGEAVISKGDNGGEGSRADNVGEGALRAGDGGGPGRRKEVPRCREKYP